MQNLDSNDGRECVTSRYETACVVSKDDTKRVANGHHNTLQQARVVLKSVVNDDRSGRDAVAAKEFVARLEGSDPHCLALFCR